MNSNKSKSHEMPKLNIQMEGNSDLWNILDECHNNLNRAEIR